MTTTSRIRTGAAGLLLAGLASMGAACSSGSDGEFVPVDPFSCPGLAYGGAVVWLESAATSEPVTGARVTMYDGATLVAELEEVTTESGLYNFAESPAGSFEILAEAEGFVTQWTRIDVEQIADPRCGETLLGNTTILLASPLAARGVLIDLDSGERRRVVVRSVPAATR